MSLHYGLALGPIDALFGIRVKDTLAWPPEQTEEENVVERMPTGLNYRKINMGLPIEECVDPAHPEILTTPRDVLIDEKKLFGGDERSGGVHGMATWLPGREDQVIPDYMAQKLGVTPERAPGFRGMGSVFFTGARGVEYQRDILGSPFAKLLARVIPKLATGFKWGSNDPRHPAASFRAMRIPRAEPLSAWVATNYGTSNATDARFNAESQVLVIENPKAKPRQDDDGKDLPAGGGFPVANPAAVLYELVASGAYDMAATEAMMDIPSFILAARIFSKEKMGVSLFWDASDGADELVAEICDHVGALLFLHPRTGLYTIRVLREDKVFAELWPHWDGVRPEMTGFRITPANAVIDGDIKARAPSELPNSMDVKYTVDDTEETGVVTIMSQAAIAAAGGAVNHAVRDRPFFRSEDVALRAAERELRIASTPALRMTVMIDRSAWAITYGDVVTVDWPSEGIANRRFRVAEVEHKDRDIRLDIIEDVFATEAGQVATLPSQKLWTPPQITPSIDTPYVTPLPAAMLIEGGISPDEIASMTAEGDVAMAHLLGSKGSLMGAEVFIGTQLGAHAWPENGMPVIGTPVARTLARLAPGEAESEIDLFALNFGPQELEIETGDKLIFVREDPRHGPQRVFQHAVPPAIMQLPDGPRPLEAQPYQYVSTEVGYAALALDPESSIHDTGKGLAPFYGEEIAEVVAIDRETGIGRIKRGIHDTVPVTIPAGSLVYHWQDGRDLPLPRARSDAGQIYYSAYLPQSAAGAAKNRVAGPIFNAMRRHDLPARPGRTTLTIDGQTAGVGGKIEIDNPAPVEVSWRTRNAMLDDAVPASWTGGNVTPEENTTFYVILWRRLRARTPAGHSNAAVAAAKWSGLTGTSFTIPVDAIIADMQHPNEAISSPSWGGTSYPTDIATGASYAVEIGAHRGRDVSIQRALLLFDVAAQTSGYGLDYGNDYGGTD